MATALRLKPFGLTRHSFPAPTASTISSRCRVAAARTYATSDRLPKIADTSVWTAMIPAFMRRKRSRKAGEAKEWNPATFYIVMFTLIGSQAIRMLTLKNNYAAYRRTTDAKIELLREVIERVQKGEDVDVEKLLGTGDEAKEREWEEGMLLLRTGCVWLLTFVSSSLARDREGRQQLAREPEVCPRTRKEHIKG